MLVIRDQQMQVFVQNAKRQFEEATFLHISKFAPAQFNMLGDVAVREIVSRGVERAEKYGFTNRGPVRFYIELMILFGIDFDTDPPYAWAAELLASRDPADQMIRAGRLHEKTLQYIETLAGQDTELERQFFLSNVGPSPAMPAVSVENGPAHPCSAEDARQPVGEITVASPDQNVPEQMRSHDQS